MRNRRLEEEYLEDKVMGRISILNLQAKLG